MNRAKFLLYPALIWIPASSTADNRLRNGSFEGGLLYWHQIDPKVHTLVKDARNGEFALRIGKGNIMSAPFVADRGQTMTVSFWVKGEKPGRVGVQMPPSAREVGTKAKRLWMHEAEQSAEVGTDWKRVSFTWPADVPADGFWPTPHYLVQIGGYDQPILIDGVTVTAGDKGTPDYVSRTILEATVECPDLPGYEENGNLLEAGKPVTLVAHVFNASLNSGQPCYFQWVVQDYEGNLLWSSREEPIAIPVGKTITRKTSLKLPAKGTVLVGCVARPSMEPPIDWKWDASLIPLTTLPYPKHATKPDFRERFGGSFAGSRKMLEKYQRLGFGWTRWFPETKWHNFQPAKDAPFRWFDEEFDLAAKHGVSQHVVLYGWPEGLMDPPGGHPLPRDMRWKADDPRWEDLTVETAWDKFVKAAAEHFKGGSIIFEIENEPEFDHWENLHAEYAKFTIRTAKLIRATDPKARIMVNNVYGIPSPVNAAFFKAGGLKHIDVVSWHDYHEGWLTDAQGIKKMRQNMDEAGGKNVEIWFNEGWAYTNTAVDEPIACTSLTSAQSTNAIACSVAEMSAAGQKKTILFHTGYEDHGQSFWDYSGPGTLLWDWYGFPLPLVAMWNVYNHHISLSDEVGFVRPPGANFTIFQDQRNGKGVMIAYADRNAQNHVTVNLPDIGAPWIAEDIMGNAAPCPGKLVLSKTGRPVILYTNAKTAGSVFLSKLEPLDRKHAGFVVTGAKSAWKLPATWEGGHVGTPDGNPLTHSGKAVWRLDMVWPDDPAMVANYLPMKWDGTSWRMKEHDAGGQPAVKVSDGNVEFAVRGPWTGVPGQRIAGLAFIAPESGRWRMTGKATSKPWTGGATAFKLGVFKKDSQRSASQTVLELPRDGSPVALDVTLDLSAGHEAVLLPLMPDWHNATNTRVSNLIVEKVADP